MSEPRIKKVVAACIIIGIVALLALTYSYYCATNHFQRGDSDFFCYYEAGKGNLDFMHPTGHVPYLYHPITAKGFAWMPTMTPYTAFLVWYWLMVGCWVVMTYHLMNIRGGWIVFFFTIPALQLNLEYCQVSPMTEIITEITGCISHNTYSDLDLPDWPTVSKKYGTIFCLEVLEHLQNPLLFLRTVKKKLMQDGVLYLTTPVRSIPLLRSPDHFHEYNRKELEILLDEAGLNVVSFGYTKSGYPRGIWWRGFRPLLRAMFQKSFAVIVVPRDEG